MRIVEAMSKTGLTVSNSEASRKIKEGAVRLNSQKVERFDLEVNEKDVIQCGRKTVTVGKTE